MKISVLPLADDRRLEIEPPLPPSVVVPLCTRISPVEYHRPRLVSVAETVVIPELVKLQFVPSVIAVETVTVP